MRRVFTFVERKVLKYAELEDLKKQNCFPFPQGGGEVL